ncbi:hypothetical protein ACH3XW_42435 [Acanthocheilonema viteae]|uniref:Uncharacterized protein n=1 Tax=Acanthocheilonema viteae TaxID=6277 RepID=A0A498SIE9_ACAVI|nr:unnamed protein product [Acanthocheilonema viteae]
MSFHQFASDSGYGSPNDYFFRCMHLSAQNIDGRKKDANDPSYIHRFFSKTNEDNPRRNVQACGKFFWHLEKVEKYTTAANSTIRIRDQYNITREIGAKLIALADAFDAEFFEI